MITDHRPALPVTPGRAGTARWLGLALLAQAATFGIASYLHRGGHIALGFTTVVGGHFPHAALPEAVIGAVLALAGAAVLAAPGRARGVAIGATAFAIAGVVVGLTVLLTGSSAHAAADFGYHAGILVTLLASVFGLARWHDAGA
jgi:hypothetical protein